MREDNHKYDDIINLSRPRSMKHPPMSSDNRAAQFSAFAALTGHSAAIQETARLTDAQMLLDDNKKEILDQKFGILFEQLEQQPEVRIVYFEPDEKKEGGKYVDYNGRLKKIDGYYKKLLFTDGKILEIKQITEIESDLFDEYNI